MSAQGSGEQEKRRVCPLPQRLSDDPNERITYCGAGYCICGEWPELDEVVVHNANIHVERMSDGHIWIGIYREGLPEIAVNLFTNPRGRATIYGRAEVGA